MNRNFGWHFDTKSTILLCSIHPWGETIQCDLRWIKRDEIHHASLLKSCLGIKPSNSTYNGLHAFFACDLASQIGGRKSGLFIFGSNIDPSLLLQDVVGSSSWPLRQERRSTAGVYIMSLLRNIITFFFLHSYYFL